MRALPKAPPVLAPIWLMAVPDIARAQQFYGDNQWVSPHGVATLVGVAGSEYSQFIATAALVPEWEFNLSFVHIYDDPVTGLSSYNSDSFYVKHRLSQTERETAGYAIAAGTGLWPEHIVQGNPSSAGESWWANLNATFAFPDDQVRLDILRFVLDTDRERSGDDAWGFTYGSRVAIYDVIPKLAVVAEVFGTTGEAYVEPSYRAGLRRESEKLVVALTYTDAVEDHVHLSFYIWLTDNNGLKMVEALKRAAPRGVTCRAFADDLGSRGMIHSQHWRDMRDAGVKLGRALRMQDPLLRPLAGRLDLRNRRKTLIIDNCISYCGSQTAPTRRFG